MNFKRLSKLSPGDTVAIVSLSSGLAGVYTDVFEAGIKALQDQFQLKAITYNSTTDPSTDFQSKVDDLHAAFNDVNVKAIIATIGGETESNIIPLLDEKIIQINPKPFFGFSDDTHFHNYLWKLGVASYYGGSIMTQYANPGGMDPLTTLYLKRALFEGGEHLLETSDSFSDYDGLWGEPQWNTTKPQMPTPPTLWDGEQVAEGVLWGGCIDVFPALVLPSLEQLKGSVLFIESSEEKPNSEFVASVLSELGEKGVLGAIVGVLVGIPKTNRHLKKYTASDSAQYRDDQARTIIETVRQYNQSAPIVQNVQFGHTDPQVVLPVGRRAKIIPSERQVYLDYS